VARIRKLAIERASDLRAALYSDAQAARKVLQQVLVGRVPFILTVGNGRTTYAFRAELTVGQLLDPRLTGEVSPKGHLKNIYQKMGAHTRSAVVSTILANAVTSAETSEPPQI